MKEPFTRLVTVVFRDGDATGFATLDAVGGRRIWIQSYFVGWRLPAFQAGVISFSPTPAMAGGSHASSGGGLYVDPGKPLSIYGKRTDSDGFGTARITFTGTQTPVPIEDKGPTDLP